MDKKKAKEYFEKIGNTTLKNSKVGIKIDNLLRDFILSGGKNIQLPND